MSILEMGLTIFKIAWVMSYCWNKDELKRASFEDKKRAYLATHYPLARQVATYSAWNLQNLNDYQAWLSKQAVETWKVAYE